MLTLTTLSERVITYEGAAVAQVVLSIHPLWSKLWVVVQNNAFGGRVQALNSLRSGDLNPVVWKHHSYLKLVARRKPNCITLITTLVLKKA